MDIFWYQALLSWLLPPGLWILLLLLIASLALIWRRREHRSALNRLAFLAAGAAALLYLASIPASASLLALPLERRFPVPPPEELKTGDCLIVLGGGAEGSSPSRTSTARLAEAAALYRRLVAPTLPVLLCGGRVYPDAPEESLLAADLLARLGIPPAVLIRESESRTTWENARKAAAILRERGLHRPVLLTSALHLSRAELAFRKAGIHVIPYPADFRGTPRSGSPQNFLPEAEALHLLRDALWEYLGMAWYRARR